MALKTARLREEARRRLLRDMGIEVWYARAGGEEPVDTGADDGAEGAAAGAGKVHTGPADGDAPGRTDNDPPNFSPAPSVPGAEQSPDADEPGPPDEVPFAVVALGLPGAVLVVDAFPRKQEAALARDLLRTARRDWSAAIGQTRFEWPQPSLSGASGPALMAFVEKQVEDFGARLLLVTESAAGRLGDCPMEIVRVPDLPALADPRNKSALWRRFQQLTP